jgi:hypothetical protein
MIGDFLFLQANFLAEHGEDIGFVLRTPTLRAGSQFRIADCGFEMWYVGCEMWDVERQKIAARKPLPQ